ncbi:MAG: flagellar biosynthetic protein FliR [Candidatus Eremiobacteraeota bacterium]|nr:flagellar biosynthetic protein FliR [Candidatus Eremiobacteraeota bacterium]
MVTGLLVFARCVGFVFRAPGFSHPSVPSSLRAGLAVVLTGGILSGRHEAVRAFDDAALVAALLTEFLIGSALGMTASLVYDGAYAGGRIVDDYVGVRAIAPSLQLVAPSGFGRVWSLALTGGFFLSGAYRPALLGFAQSFARMAPGAPLQRTGWIEYASAFSETIVVVALQIAAPALATAFVAQIALGALSRVIPRFGSFTLAFPLTFAAALIATAICMPVMAVHVREPLLSIP